jgi:hypothetical protein
MRPADHVAVLQPAVVSAAGRRGFGPVWCGSWHPSVSDWGVSRLPKGACGSGSCRCRTGQGTLVAGSVRLPARVLVAWGRTGQLARAARRRAVGRLDCATVKQP